MSCDKTKVEQYTKIVTQTMAVLEKDWIHKSHNAPVPYPTIHLLEQKCAHFRCEWCIVGYGTDELWDLGDILLN